MRIKLDENLSRHLKASLAQFGLDMATVADECLLGRPDVEVGVAAKNEGRMLFTLDVEFADLRKYPPGSHPGIFLFRPGTMGPLAVNRFIIEFVRKTELADFVGCTVIVEPGRIRLRHPPPLPNDEHL